MSNHVLTQLAAGGDVGLLEEHLRRCSMRNLTDGLILEMLEKICGQSSRALTLQLAERIVCHVWRTRNNDMSLFTYSALQNVMAKAIEKDEVPLMEYLMRLSGPLNGQAPSYERSNDCYQTELKAIGPRSVNMMQVLERYGFDIDQRVKGHTPLHYALTSPYADGDMIQLMKYLASRVYNINEKDEHGYIPFHAWLLETQEERWRGKQAVVQHITSHLLDHGASLTAKAKEENDGTALHIAVESCSTSLVELLLVRGADPNAKNMNGETALHYAERFRDCRPEDRGGDKIRVLRHYGGRL